jgi:large conductance mechanosensitive channel
MMGRLIATLKNLNAMSLALGVIIGAAVGKVVTSLTGDILMPVLSLVIPGGSWRDTEIVLKRDAAGAVVNAIKVGSFAGTLVDFLIIATVVGWLTKLLIRPDPAPAGPPMKQCPECRESILAAARKCKHCGSAVGA